MTLPVGMVASTVRTRALGRDAACLAGVLLLVCGCGSSGASGPSVTASPSETIASSPRLESPSPSPGSRLGLLGPNNCTESPAPNSSRTDSHIGATIDVPSAWTVLPNSQATETVELGLESPSDYSNTPTRIGIFSLMGSWPTGTDPGVPLSDWYQPAPPNGHPEFNVTVVGTPQKCTVASRPAAYFEYTAAGSQSTGSATPSRFAARRTRVHGRVPAWNTRVWSPDRRDRRHRPSGQRRHKANTRLLVLDGFVLMP